MYIDFAANPSIDDSHLMIDRLRGYLEKHAPGSCLIIDRTVWKWKLTLPDGIGLEKVSRGMKDFLVIPTPTPIPTEEEIRRSRHPPVHLVLHHPHPDP